MILHNDRKSLEEIIIQTANHYNIDVSIIEKLNNNIFFKLWSTSKNIGAHDKTVCLLTLKTK